MEKPLISSASCLLSSVNLSQYVINPFEDNAEFDYTSFKEDMREIVIFMDDLLEEGLEYLPLDKNKEMTRDYRSLGIGVMGLADALIKLGLTYGKRDAIAEIEKIFKVMINVGLQQSSLLAKERGTYPKYDKKYVLKSTFINSVADNKTIELIEQYGLRNVEVLSVAPTGSISTMLGVSGGIEPVFQLEYNRKTVTLNEGETTYKVVSPIVKEYQEVTGQNKELPSYFVTAYDIPYRERVDMQSAVQKYIDSAISSTVNLPEDTTVEEVEDLYMYAWKKKLKGITVYRENCFRAGILTSEEKPKVEDKSVCPSCGGKMMVSNGCSECQDCGFSMCSI